MAHVPLQIDCPTICAEFSRGEIMDTIRGYLSTLPGYDPTFREMELFVFGLAKYKNGDPRDETLRGQAMADCREWMVHGTLPCYMGSWFNEARKCPS
jgi:hypothetical protein